MNTHLSVVTTLYRSDEYIEEFYQRIKKECQKITPAYEIIFVNDGSPDNSLEAAKQIFTQDPRVRVIDLSRNFGHHKAIMTGLSYAKGKYVFLIDSDLEEPPELLTEFYQALTQDESLDAVQGVQKQRKGGFLERISGFLYYKVVNALIDFPIPENFLTVRIMSRQFVAELMRYRERDLNFSNLLSHTGFKTKSLLVSKGHKGKTTYSWGAKLRIFENTITSSSAKPLWLIFNLGALITLTSIIVMIYFLYRKLMSDIAVEGWTSLIISIWFIGGALMLSTGIVGIYMSKIFLEVKARPLVNIRHVYSRSEKEQN